jgi:DNA (cytosine-5)-methyltransferase 1
VRAQINLLDEMIIDNFAGGGGASTGIELATGRPVDVAINHDPDAILMHKTNHPFTKHHCEDVWEIDPRKVTQGRTVALCWLSPDCKHFSKAKGSKPVSKHIRGLAWVAVRWAATVNPRVIILENVEEFKTWGPLKNGMPDIDQKGRTFNSFVNALRRQGYDVDWRELRACDYGAPTIRKRFFLIARCDGKPIVWPAPTHGEGLLPYRTAAEIIDWSIPCPSIFATSEEIKEQYGINAVRPLSENTMRRIARGIQKFVINNADPFIVPIGYGEREGQTPRVQSVNEPLSTIVGKPKHFVVAPVMTAIGQTGFSDDRSYSVDTPVRTIVSKAEQCIVAPSLMQYHSYDDDARGQSVDKPLLTVDASNRYGLVSAFISRQFGTSTGHNLDQPLGTVTGVDKSRLVEAFLIKYYGQGTGQDLKAPLDTIVSKDRFGLVTIHGEDFAIVDIGMRMLEPKELYAAQGFPSDYIIDHDYTGTMYPKSKQVARCGNSVPPPFAEALTRANLPELCGKKIGTMEELTKEIAI